MNRALQIFYVSGALTMAWNAIQWARLSLGYAPLGEPPQKWLAAVIFALWAVDIGWRAIKLERAAR